MYPASFLAHVKRLCRAESVVLNHMNTVIIDGFNTKFRLRNPAKEPDLCWQGIMANQLKRIYSDHLIGIDIQSELGWKLLGRKPPTMAEIHEALGEKTWH